MASLFPQLYVAKLVMGIRLAGSTYTLLVSRPVRREARPAKKAVPHMRQAHPNTKNPPFR